MNKKPIIGISSSVLKDSGGIFPGYERAYVNKDYVDAVVHNGGIPIIIPFTTDEEIIKAQADMIDALILSGGHDILPLNYGEEPLPKLGEVFPERDTYDYCLFKQAKKRKIPILGICRGIQVINTCEGGTLYQDLSYIENGSVYKHFQGHGPTIRTHGINIENDSLLYEILKTNKTTVNSFHHQALKSVPKEYKVIAKAGDGVIEAIQAKDYPFILGLQWHPEMLFSTNEDMNEIFKFFINKAK